MKKLLSILTSLSVASVAATSVVACSTPSTRVDVEFIAPNLTYNADGTYTYGGEKGAKYSVSELDAALNGNFAVINNLGPQYKVAMSFDDLNYQLISLLSFNSSLAVKTQQDNKQTRDFKENYLGRDANGVSDFYTPSVDGSIFKGLNDDNNKYYSGFKNTTINSLVGLQKLYEASNKGVAPDDWGSGAKASLKVAEEIFGKNDENVKTLMDNFANSRKNPAFTNITYSFEKGLDQFDSYSQVITPFDENSDSNKLTLSDAKKYEQNNSDVSADDAKPTDKDGNGKKLQDMSKANPYGVLVLPSDGETKITTGDFKDFGYDSKTNSDMTLKELFESDKANVKYAITNDDNGKYSFTQNIGQYFVKKADKFDVTYHFETDLNHDAQSWKDSKKGSEGFNITFTVNNLAEVFSPYISPVAGVNVNETAKDGKTGKMKVYFNKSADDLKKLQKKSWTDDDVKSDKAGTYIEVDSGSPVTYTETNGLVRNYTITTEPAKFDNTQLSWVFRGYKFISDDAMKSKDKFGWLDKDDDSITTEAWVAKDSNGAPVRDGNLKAEIDHNLRDINTTGWKIEKADPVLPDKK